MATRKVEKTVPYVIVRTQNAGVFAGNLVEQGKETVILMNVRRIWYWKGAASLSQLAMEGVTCPQECKFSMPVIRQDLNQVIEIIYTTKEAEKNIREVPEWKII